MLVDTALYVASSSGTVGGEPVRKRSAQAVGGAGDDIVRGAAMVAILAYRRPALSARPHIYATAPRLDKCCSTAFSNVLSGSSHWTVASSSVVSHRRRSWVAPEEGWPFVSVAA